MLESEVFVLAVLGAKLKKWIIEANLLKTDRVVLKCLEKLSLW